MGSPRQGSLLAPELKEAGTPDGPAPSSCPALLGPAWRPLPCFWSGRGPGQPCRGLPLTRPSHAHSCPSVPTDRPHWASRAPTELCEVGHATQPGPGHAGCPAHSHACCVVWANPGSQRVLGWPTGAVGHASHCADGLLVWGARQHQHGGPWRPGAAATPQVIGWPACAHPQAQLAPALALLCPASQPGPGGRSGHGWHLVSPPPRPPGTLCPALSSHSSWAGAWPGRCLGWLVVE